MAEHDKQPWRTYRTGTVHCTISEAHPYHNPVGKGDYKGAGGYEHAYDTRCPLCRAEESSDAHVAR